MKNTQLLVSRSDIHDHLMGLWKTDIFKSSHQSGGFVHNIVERFSRLPRFFTEMSDDYLERAHFNIWWSGLHPREYADVASHDLYLLHEISHGADMSYIPGQSAENFHRKMVDNELWASVTSEIFVYFALPEMRDLSFKGEIFADRFLGDPLFQMMYRDDPVWLFQELSYRRRQAMFNPRPGDKVEAWLHKFTAQNDKWFEIWQENYNQVETRMHALTRLSVAGERREALLRHIDWLTSSRVTKGSEIPFVDEAAAFAGVYWKNKESSGSASAGKEEKKREPGRSQASSLVSVNESFG
jgi:hypothetical protein